MTEPDMDHSRELIAFRIGEQEFCVDIQSVREIRGWTAATPLPDAPAYVQGVINLRGMVLPIVDLSRRLGLGAVEPSARHVIIVSQIGDRTIGLLVEGVSDILTISEETIQHTHDLAGEGAKARIRGIVPIDGRMLSIVALEDLLRDPEVRAAA